MGDGGVCGTDYPHPHPALEGEGVPIREVEEARLYLSYNKYLPCSRRQASRVLCTSPFAEAASAEIFLLR